MYGVSDFRFSMTPSPCKACPYNNDCDHDCERYDRWCDLRQKEIKLFFLSESKEDE